MAGTAGGTTRNVLPPESLRRLTRPPWRWPVRLAMQNLLLDFDDMAGPG